MRTILTVIVVVVSLVEPVRAEDDEWPEHVRTLRAETMRAAVAAWCDEHTDISCSTKDIHFVCFGTK